MADPVKNSLKRLFAADWLNNFNTNSRDRYFMIFGRTESWGTGPSWEDGSDTEPRLARDNTSVTFGTWRDAIGAKRIRQIDAYHAIRRYDYTSDVIWDEYDPDIELFREEKPPYESANIAGRWPKQFYVITNENHVYMCISNNRGQASTVQPNGTSSNIIELSDGYRWKYMYTVPETLYQFMTNDYIPVQYIETLNSSELLDETRLQWDVQQAAKDGRIDHVDVVLEGDAFERTVPSCVTETKIGREEIGENDPRIGVTGTGITGGDVRAELILSQEPFAYSAIDDYYNGYSVVISSGAGAGQVRHITGYKAASRTLYLDRKWQDSLSASQSSDHSVYSIVPKCTIRGDGSEAEASVKLYSQDSLADPNILTYKKIEKINIVSGGSNYTTGTADIYPRGNVIDTPAVEPVVKVMVPPKGGFGSNPVKELGSDQIMAVVTFERDESGDFNITNDYRSIGIVKNPLISSGGASGGGLHTGKIAGTEQPVTAVMTIDAITGDGTRLFADTSFISGDYIIGDRSNAVGRVSRFTYDLTSKDFGLLTIYDINAGDFIGTAADGSVTGEAINAFRLESGAWNFTTGSSVATVRSITPYNNDTDLTYKLFTEVNVQATSGQDALTATTYPQDTVLVGEDSSTTGVVLNWTPGTNGTTGTLHLVAMDGEFKTGENIYDISLFLPETSDQNYSLTSPPQVSTVSSVNVPELVKGSGELVYIQNMRPVLRNFEQDEDIKVVLGF